MIILYTKNLQEFIGLKGRNLQLPVFANPDALWHGNIFVHKRRNVIHLAHEFSRYAIFIYGVTKKDLKDLPQIINEHLHYHIMKNKIPIEEARYILDISENFSYFKKTNRSVLGTMNNQRKVFEIMCEEENTINDKLFSYEINKMIFKAEDGEYYHPFETFKEYFSATIELRKYSDDFEG